MRIAVDLGGCVSKYPELFMEILDKLSLKPMDFGVYYNDTHTVYFITDQHPKEEVLKTLELNKIAAQHWFNADNVYCADYEKYGNFCKAVLLKELQIDIFIDDHLGYLEWPTEFGPKPLLLLVIPDAHKPYWSKKWVTDSLSDFGRRVYTPEPEKLNVNP